MRQLLSFLLICVEIWVPAVVLSWPAYRARPVHADAFSDAARQGQAFGKSVLPAPSATQDAHGNLILNWGGSSTTFKPEDLFPDQRHTTNPGSLRPDTSADINAQTSSQVGEMGSSASQTGEAFRAVTQAASRPRLNMSADPIWSLTDTMITKALNGEFSECHTDLIQISGTSTAHIPDYKTCEKIIMPVGGVCRLYHDYSIEPKFDMSFSWCATTNDDANLTIDLKVPRVLSCWGHHSVSGCRVSGPPIDYAASCSVSEGMVKVFHTGSSGYLSGIGQHPSCANNFIATTYVHNSPGSHSTQTVCGWATYKGLHLVDKGWTADPGCEIFLSNPDGDAFIKPTAYECSLGPCEFATAVSGVWVSSGDLYSPNPMAAKGISNLAREVTVRLAPFNQGTMETWVDPQGTVHSPDNTADRTNTCEALETNPNCAFVREECIEGARDPKSGKCYAYTLLYDCGYDVTVGNGAQTTIAMICNGMVRCLGTDCIDGQFDTNSNDFGKAAALLQAAQYASTDLNCTDPSNCVIFQGQPYYCKKALGGWVDCCQEPSGVSLVDYIKLLTNSYSLAAADWNLANFGPLAHNPFSGVYSRLSDTTDYLSEMISSAWDSLASNASDTITIPVGQTLTERLMDGAYNWMSDNFPGLADVIFDTSGIFTEFAPWISTAMNFVQFALWAYTVYNVLDILVHIIWSCEQAEFELGAKKQLKVCHYVGSYCKSKVLGMCIEKRDRYCCFNSPLSRILQEQVRLQTGRGWGSGDSPDCGGMTPAELQSVNWDLVDLSEWLALLTIAGKAPSQRDLSLDGLTGSGSQFNFNNIGRDDSSIRAVERLQVYEDTTGNTLEDLRIEKGLRLHGQ